MTPEHREKLIRDYQRTDPWGFQTHPDDAARKEIILRALAPRRFSAALDFGCGEGWITKDLPAGMIYGWDVVPAALARCPPYILRWDGETPATFDLVVATGVLYSWYDGAEVVERLRRAASGLVLTCHMAHEEIPEVASLGRQIACERFSYRGMTECLRIFER